MLHTKTVAFHQLCRSIFPHPTRYLSFRVECEGCLTVFHVTIEINDGRKPTDIVFQRRVVLQIKETDSIKHYLRVCIRVYSTIIITLIRIIHNFKKA